VPCIKSGCRSSQRVPRCWDGLVEGLRTKCACIGGASTAKEPGHFEVRTSSSQVTRLHFFSSKKLTTFSVSGQIWYKFHFLFTLLPKQSKAIGRAEPGRSQGGGSSSQPGHLTMACPGVAQSPLYLQLPFVMFCCSYDGRLNDSFS